jgi:hypothetical protein
MNSDAARRLRVERLRDWFALQLDFCEALVSKSTLSPHAALTFYTNLHRRFGFGRAAKDSCVPEWDGFVRDLVALRTREERIEHTQTFARSHLTTWQSAADAWFGCFGFDAPKEGVVRIHFAPNDSADGSGPLSSLKRASRAAELAEMFAFIRAHYAADARYVAGGSWLYQLEAYRRLFPARYLASLRIHDAPRSLDGGAWWGQFVDHDENVVEARVRRFSANLVRLDPTRLWNVFPLPAMIARADIEAFYQHCL